MLAAVVAVVALSFSKRHFDACRDARRTIFAVTLGQSPAADQPDALKTVRTRCRDASDLAFTAAALKRQGREAEAVSIATLAARREPENAQALNALAIAARRSDPALARRAQSRARALNPLG